MVRVKNKDLPGPKPPGQTDSKPYDKDQIVASSDQQGLEQAAPPSFYLDHSKKKEHKKKRGESEPEPADQGRVNKQRGAYQEEFCPANALPVLTLVGSGFRKKRSNENRQGQKAYSGTRTEGEEPGSWSAKASHPNHRGLLADKNGKGYEEKRGVSVTSWQGSFLSG